MIEPNITLLEYFRAESKRLTEKYWETFKNISIPTQLLLNKLTSPLLTDTMRLIALRSILPPEEYLDIQNFIHLKKDTLEMQQMCAEAEQVLAIAQNIDVPLDAVNEMLAAKHSDEIGVPIELLEAATRRSKDVVY